MSFLLPNYAPSCGLARAIEDGQRELPRPPETWVRVFEASPQPHVHAECIVRHRDGRHFVGRLISHPEDPFIEVELLGASDQSVWFEKHEAKLSLMPPHTWAERRQVAERQRRGEPAAVHEPIEQRAVLERVRRGVQTRLTNLELKRAGRADDPVPRGLIRGLASDLGVEPRFVAKAYRLFVFAHGNEPSSEELLDMCAQLERAKPARKRNRALG